MREKQIVAKTLGRHVPVYSNGLLIGHCAPCGTFRGVPDFKTPKWIMRRIICSMAVNEPRGPLRNGLFTVAKEYFA